MTLYDRAKKVIPGGVNSPVRAFGSVHMDPIFFNRAKGCKIYSTEGKEYIDYIGSWGPMILGHSRQDLIKKAQGYLEEVITLGLPSDVEVEMAETFTKATKTDMVRMVNSGTEATMSAIRLARGYTGENKIIKFEGCYHGHSDGLLVKSGSGTLTYHAPTSLGVPQATIEDTLVCRYNDLEDVEAKFQEFKDQIACIIIEPIAGNMGVVIPDKEFLQGLRKLCDQNQAILIFDEVITGFRTRYGSVGEFFDVKADLYTYGKIIGGGLPVGAFAGSREIMEKLSPLGGVYQAGTLSGNPLAMKMGLDTLHELESHPEIYDKLDQFALELDQGFCKNLKEVGIPGKVTRFHGMMSLFFGEFDEIKSFDDVQAADTDLYEKYFHGMVEEGFILAPAQFEAIFLSDAHTEDVIQKTLEANRRVLEKISKS